MTTRTRTIWQDGIAVGVETYEIPDELDREEQLGDKLDQRITFLANQIATMPATLTAAYIRVALRMLMVTVLWMLRMQRRRFDAVEE